MVGVGILWGEGYTNQFIDSELNPYDCPQEYSRDQLEDTGICCVWIRMKR